MSTASSAVGAPNPTTALPSLSVVIPAWNAAATLPRVVESLLDEVDRSPWPGVEVVLVDDGSDDDTATSLDHLADRCRLQVVRQENLGRFRARLTGLRAASSDLVLLIDSRVSIRTGSLTFLAEQVGAGRLVWNGHAHTVPSPALPAHYWDAITAVAWRRYYRDPRHVEIDEANYDYYPKGTTMFVAPRDRLLAACEQFETAVDQVEVANDDTLLLRPLLEDGVINLAPGFACDYEARDSMRSFVRHSFHRGTVLIDGHDRPGSRLRIPIRVSIALAPLCALVALRRPRTAIATMLAGTTALGVVARWAGADRRASLSLAVLTPIFAPAYLAGMMRGMALKMRSRRTRPAETS